MATNHKVNLQEWMAEHPEEYRAFVKKTTNNEFFLKHLCEKIIEIIPEYQVELENQTECGMMDFEKLMGIIRHSDKLHSSLADFDNPDLIAFMAWIKYGQSYELVLDNLDNLDTEIKDKNYMRSIFSTIKFVVKKFNKQSPQKLKEFGEFRHWLKSGDITSIISSIVAEDTTPTEKIEDDMIEEMKITHDNIMGSDLISLLSSHDETMVKRIDEFVRLNHEGIDLAYLLVALIEIEELHSETKVVVYHKSLKLSYPQIKIVGCRQIQKDYARLKDYSGKNKPKVKDTEPHRTAINNIKENVLRGESPETAD